MEDEEARKRERAQALTQQPLVATVCATIVAVAAIVGIVIIRVETNDVPVGLVGIGTAAVTGIVMSSGRRRV